MSETARYLAEIRQRTRAVNTELKKLYGGKYFIKMVWQEKEWTFIGKQRFLFFSWSLSNPYGVLEKAYNPEYFLSYCFNEKEKTAEMKSYEKALNRDA